MTNRNNNNCRISKPKNEAELKEILKNFLTKLNFAFKLPPHPSVKKRSPFPNVLKPVVTKAFSTITSLISMVKGTILWLLSSSYRGIWLLTLKIGKLSNLLLYRRGVDKKKSPRMYL